MKTISGIKEAKYETKEEADLEAARLEGMGPRFSCPLLGGEICTGMGYQTKRNKYKPGRLVYRCVCYQPASVGGPYHEDPLDFKTKKYFRVFEGYCANAMFGDK